MPSKTKAATAAVKPHDEAVRHRAYMLWEADGRPNGMSDHYWHLAVAELSEVVAKPAKASKAAPAKPEAAKAEKPAKKAEPVAKKAAPKPRAAVATKKPAKAEAASA